MYKSYIKLFIYLFILILPNILFATTWSISNGGKTATTSPSDYDDNTDISTTLSIAGATTLKVTITGVTEDGYDFLYVTANGNTQTFDGNINTSFNVAGSSISIRFTSDNSETKSGVTVSIQDISNGAGWVQNQGGWINLKLNKDFSLIYENNVKGDFAATGNTIMDGTGTLYASNPAHLNQDSTLSAFGTSSKNRNSSSAPLTLPSYVNANHIIWAGLFWQAQIHDNATNTNDVDNDVAGWNTVRIRTPDGNIHVITADTNTPNDLLHSTYNYAHMRDGNYRYFYSAYADVTNIIKNSGYTTTNNNFTVGNIMSTDDVDQADYIYFNHINEPAGQWYNGLRMGHFGGWSLVVVYDVDLATMNSNPSVTYKNVSIYNGYDLFSFWTGNAGDKFETTLSISGFKTPRDGIVSSKMLFFGGGGDSGIDKDTLQIEDGNNPTNYIDLTNSKNTGTQKFNGTYTNFNNNIISGKNYFQGMDLDIFDSSSMMAHDQNSTKIKFGVIQKTNEIDQVFPQTIAFSTELYQPEVCYDFVAKRNESIIPYKDHTAYEAYAEKDDEISFTIVIWDIKGDIDPRKVSLGLNVVSQANGHISAIENPDKAYYTLKNGNTLLGTDYADPMTTSTRPVITIGAGRTTNTGGTIKPDEQYYSKFYFKVDNTNSAGLISGDYLVEVNATFNYGGGDFWQLMNVTRCPQNDTYTPTWVQFNVEKVFPSTIPTDETAHYSLPTRIAGKDFEYSVASYTTNAGGAYTVPVAANGITVDVEMIDIGAFDDNNSHFKCGNSDPSIIVKSGNFVYFDNNLTRKNVFDPNDLSSTYPVRNATFRMWLLADENGTLTSDANYHNKQDNAYFSGLYTNTFQAQDINGLCSTACTPPYNYDSPRYPTYDLQAQGCYACLRDYFAQPYCARDNFAIRPKAIRAKLFDRNKDGQQTPIIRAQNDNSATPDDNVTIAAGYKYELALTIVDDQDNRAYRYYTTDEFKQALSLATVPVKSDTNSALVKFEGASGCNDTTHKTLFARFYDGQYILDSNTTNAFHVDNAGLYSFEIWDSNFTLVDNASKNPNKTVFDPNCLGSLKSTPECNDCVLNSTNADENAVEKTGCIFSSDQAGSNNYSKLNLTLNPYAYDLSVSLKTIPNPSASWLYMNNLNATAYVGSPASRAQSMAIVLEGNASAIGADNGKLSNYTTDCAAQDVMLWLDRNMTISPESNIVDENGTQVGFEQWLYSTVAGAAQSVEDNMGNGDMNASLVSLNFKNENNGSAEIKLYYNFNKPYNSPVNPIDVNFTMLHAASLNAQSFADQQTNYIPDGNTSALGDKWFVFAKVAPKIGDEYVTTYDSNYTTYLRVDTFCINKPGVNCSVLQGLGILGPNEEAITTGVSAGGAWYRSAGHVKNLDGNVTLSADISGISELPVPLSSITFDNNGSSADITLTYPIGNVRPKDFVLTLTPDEWLKYDPIAAKNGLPTFTIRYRTQGLRWKGEGDTGHVINTQPSSGDNRRMNW